MNQRCRCDGCKHVRSKGYGARHCLNPDCSGAFYRVRTKDDLAIKEWCPDCEKDETEPASPHVLLAPKLSVLTDGKQDAEGGDERP